MTFKICDKCKATNIETLVPKLKEIDNTATIDIRCHNFCGIGRTKPFVIVDHIPVIGQTEDELIEKVIEHLRNK